MSLLAQLERVVDVASAPSSPASLSTPTWSATLASLGWGAPIISTLAAITRAQGPGFLRANYTNVLTVLKSGPSHPAAGKVAGILDRIAGATAVPASAGLATRPGGAKEKGEGEVVGEADASKIPGPWPSLAELDEADGLMVKLDELDATGAGWYAGGMIKAFHQGVAARNIKRCRSAYIAVLEKWLDRRSIVRGFDDGRRERRRRENLNGRHNGHHNHP